MAMNSSDDQLIRQMAVVWVDGGGDAEGINWCVNALWCAVHDEIQKRSDAEHGK